MSGSTSLPLSLFSYLSPYLSFSSPWLLCSEIRSSVIKEHLAQMPSRHDSKIENLGEDEGGYEGEHGEQV